MLFYSEFIVREFILFFFNSHHSLNCDIFYPSDNVLATLLNKKNSSTYTVVRYGNLDTWINIPRLYPPRFYQPRYNLGRFYLRRYYPS